MLQYILKRLLLMIPTFIGITFITFLVMKLAPGDPVSLKLMFAGQGINPQALAAELAKKEDPLELPGWYVSFMDAVTVKSEDSKLDSPARKSLTWVGTNTLHYLKWTANMVRLDFGYSIKDKQPVLKKIQETMPITLTLNILAILIVYFISIPLGVWSALRRDSVLDKIVMIKLFILYSLPEFWVGTILLVYLAGGDYLNLFPMTGIMSSGVESWSWTAKLVNIAWHLVLPLTVYVYGSFAFLSRFSRANFLEIIGQDFVRTARAKGLGERTVLWRHAFRNSLIPLVTLMGGLLPGLLGGSVVVEQIFSIPGMGMLSFEAVLGRDYNVIMGLATISSFLTLISLLLSDLLYVLVDPRISFESQG